MKKIILSLAFSGIAAMACAQSFTIMDANSTNVTGTTQNYWIDQDVQDAHHYEVTNTSANTINVRVRRTIIQLNTPTAVTLFCTDINCYSSTQNMSIIFSVAPGGHFDLTADYFPDSTGGMGHVRYSVMNQSVASDSSTLDIIYNSAPASVRTNTLVKPSISNPAPNPASSMFAVSYKMGSTNPQAAKMVIYNMLGERVMETNVEEMEGIVKMDVSTLGQGVYFCSLESDGKTLTTRRLVVTH
jgi:hypothetical protein